MNLFALAAAFEAVFAAAQQRGLDLNMDVGKTELLCALVGPGARAAKIRLAEAHFAHPFSLHGQECSLRVTTTYKHLGLWRHDSVQALGV